MGFSNLTKVQTETKYGHVFGSLVMFNGSLTVIGGLTSNGTVEVFDNALEQWNDSMIEKAPEEFLQNIRITSLVVTESGIDALFIFGEFL